MAPTENVHSLVNSCYDLKSAIFKFTFKIKAVCSEQSYLICIQLQKFLICYKVTPSTFSFEFIF